MPTHIVIDAGIGSGPPLILVHGVGLDHTMWDLVVPVLASEPSGPNKIVRYDLFGHGQTEASANELTMVDFVDQLYVVLEELDVAAAELDVVADEFDSPVRPDVVGLSLGGAIVRGAAARNPHRFGRVVIANTVFERSVEQRQGNLERLKVAAEQGMGAVAKLAVDRWFTASWQQAHPERVAAIDERLGTTNLDGYLEAYRIFVDGDTTLGDQLSALTNETLIVTGDRDSGSTPAMTHAMAALVHNATARILPDTGHLPPIEHPDIFSRLLIDFLGEATP